MRNCLVAQSGGPTAVINASVVGIVEGNNKTKYYDNVYGGFNGIEGILEERMTNLSKLTKEELEVFKHTPSSGLGSCRYKIADYEEDDKEYIKFFELMDKYEIQTFFYIGGNDSMDTVNKFSKYAELHNIDKQIIGIPKTIDNDLYHTDHTPGFGSAAKFIATRALETYLDSSVYTYNGIFILETMGRDTGWLAAAATLARIDGKPVADFIYLPEVEFSIDKFLKEVKEKYEANNKVYIVASEGLKDSTGQYICETDAAKKHDKFAHAQLGGVGAYLRSLIIEAGITTRVKSLELGVGQRAGMYNASKTDINSAYTVGLKGYEYSTKGDKGFMVAIRRLSNEPYEIETFQVDPAEIANQIKYLPKEWITEDGNNVNEKAYEYISPLIMGKADIVVENGLPKFMEFDFNGKLEG